MYPVSANFHTLAIQDAPKTRVRIYFIGDAVDCTDDNAVQTNGTLLIGKAGDTDSNGRIGQNGITFSEFFNPDKNIQVGAAVSSQIGMTLLNTDGALDNFQYGRCKVYLDVYDSVNSAWLTCPMGVYIIDLPTKRKVQLVNATGYDQMQKLDEICDTWWSALNWSGGITLSQLLTSLATQIGVSVSSNTASAIVNGSASFTEEPFQCVEVTYREVLEYIAEATGTVARFDRNGALDLRWFEQSGDIETNTYTGNPVSFVGTSNTSVSSAVVPITPIQNLNGYDSPWPAGGGVSKCPSFANGTHTATNGLTVTIQDGEITINGTASSSGYYQESIEATVMPADAYVSFNNPVGTYNIAYVFINGNTQIASTSTAPANATKKPTGLSGATVNKLRIFCNAGTYDNFKMSPIVHDGSTPQAWQPYANICPITGRTGANVYVSPTEDVADATTYAVAFGEAGTVYGGTVDVTTGVLTVDRAMVDFGANTWYPSTLAGRTRFWARITGIAQISAPNIVAPMLCSNYPTKTANQTYSGTTGVSLQQNSDQIYIYDPQTESMTGDEFKSAMSGVQLCYELATPVTYQLTSQQITALVGQNYVWSSVGNAITVETATINPITIDTDTVGNQCLAISVAEYSVAAVDLLKVKLYTDDIGTTVGTGTNQYTIVNNLFLDGANSAAIIAKATPIYNRLHGLGVYSPVSARIIMDWSIEAGDIINIVNGGTTYSVPIFQQSMAWRGGYVVSDLLSDGDNVRPVLDYDERTYYRLNSEMSKKVGDNEIISKINQSPESITIQANKVNLTGYVTFTNLSTSGQTSINGGNITTGTIDASVVNVTNINASNITTGTLSADYIKGGALELGGPGDYRGKITIYPSWANPADNMIGTIDAASHSFWGTSSLRATGQTTKEYYLNHYIGWGDFSSKVQEKTSGTLKTLSSIGFLFTETTNPYGVLKLHEYSHSNNWSQIKPTEAVFASSNNIATTKVSQTDGKATTQLESGNYYATLAASQTDGKSTLQLLTNTASNHDGTVRVDGIYLDTSGSTFDSVIDVTPRRCYAALSSAGWYRVLKFTYPNAADIVGAGGIQIDFVINRSVGNTDNETHRITLEMAYNNVGFVNESSRSNALGITKIRYNANTTGTTKYGYVDIYYDLSVSNPVCVDFNVYALVPLKAAITAGTLQGVVPSPANETRLAEYGFIDTSGKRNTFTPAYGTSAFGGCWYARNGEYVTVHVGLTGLTANTTYTIGTLPVGYRPIVQCCSAGSSATYDAEAHLYVRDTGNIEVWSPNTAASLDATFMWR